MSELLLKTIITFIVLLINLSHMFKNKVLLFNNNF